MKKDNVILAIWRCIYPLLIHFAVTFGLAFGYMFIGMFLVGFQSAMGGDGITVQEVMDSYYKNSLYLLLATSCICVPVFALLFRGDKKKAQCEKEKETSPAMWISLIIMAVAMCISLNALIGFTGLDKISKSYQSVAEVLYSGGILLEIITVGILGPICEELVFRGLMFHRMCQYIKPEAAVVLSALIFGIYHGNIVQGVYAFILGVIIAVCYRRFGTIWAPIGIHVAANITSVCMTEVEWIGTILEKSNVLIIATILTTVVWVMILTMLLKKNFKR